jgi:proline iminopeptidase
MAAAPALGYRADSMADGVVRRIPISTPKGTFEVYTRTVGSNPTTRLLLLHGGPGATHEYFESFDRHLPAEGIEYIYYDQLGSAHSDQPVDPDLWTVERFVDEVEQVRVALGLDRSNFFLLGHSWGGMLAMEYALAHQEHIKGLVISNMMASGPAYNAYAHDVLMPRMDQGVLAEIKGYEERGEIDNPRYMELLVPHHYEHHVLRAPAAEWPDAVNRAFSAINQDIYVPIQGPSELGAGGILLDWDRSGDLGRIRVPTLVIGAEHDTMDPAHMRWMADELPHGSYLHCPAGSHMAMWDDEQAYFDGLIDWIRRVERAETSR